MIDLGSAGSARGQALPFLGARMGRRARKRSPRPRVICLARERNTESAHCSDARRSTGAAAGKESKQTGWRATPEANDGTWRAEEMCGGDDRNVVTNGYAVANNDVAIEVDM